MKPYKSFSFKNILIDLILLFVCGFVSTFFGIAIVYELDIRLFDFAQLLTIFSFFGVLFFYLIRRQHSIILTLFQVLISFVILIGLYFLFYYFVNSAPPESKSNFYGWPIFVVLIATVLSKHFMDDELNYQRDKKKNN